MVTLPNDKGYKSKLKEIKNLHKELYKVQRASNMLWIQLVWGSYSSGGTSHYAT